MPDIFDKAEEDSQLALDSAIYQQRKVAAAIPVGEPGDCEFCGEWTGRLVGGACAPCRDKRKLP